MADPITSSGSVGQVQVVAQGITLSRTAQPDPTSSAPGMPPEGAVAHPSARGNGKDLRADAVARALAESKAAASPNLEEASSSLLKYLEGLPSNLQFRADSDSGRYLFKVVNPVTQEVIRQFPADEVLEMAKRIKQQLTFEGAGILLDEKL